MSERDVCQQMFEQRLSQPDGEAAWQRHLRRCDVCREQEQGLRDLLEPLRAERPPALSRREAVVAEDQFIARIRQQNGAADPATRSRPAKPRRIAALAASILLLLGVAYYGWQALRHDRGRPAGTWIVSDGERRPPTTRPRPQPHHRMLKLRVTAHQGSLWYRQPGQPARQQRPPLLPGAGALETVGPKSSVVLESTARDLWLRLGPRSLLRRIEQRGYSLRLDRGELMVDVRNRKAGGALRILTPQGEITIKGTRFLVQSNALKTTLNVFRGTVRYHANSGSTHEVRAGQVLLDDSRRVAVRQSSASQPAMLSTSRQATGAKRASRDRGCRLSRVRKLLRMSRVRQARAAIAACRKGGVYSTTATVLKVLDAQALMALGKIGAAVRAQLKIARQHRGSRVGQNALFTAGQLQLTRLGQRKRALATFRRYLRAYPRGRYSAEAKQLVRSLGGR